MTRRVPMIVLACALLLTVAFWYLLYQPRSDELAAIRGETAQLEGQRSQLRAQITSLREVEDGAEDYRSRLERLTELVPDDPAQPAVLRELQRASDESGVDITEMVFGDPEAVEGAPVSGDGGTVLGRIATQMTVEGGYFQVLDLLRRIEVDLARAIKIDTVGMAGSQDEGFPRLSATWTGHVFAVLPASEVGGDVGLPAASGGDAAPGDPAASPDTPTEQATDTAPDGTTDVGTS